MTDIDAAAVEPFAWPPTLPPTGRTDTTVMAGAHPSDHNVAAAALADIVARMGVNGALAGWSGIDTPSTGVTGVHVAAACNYTVPAGGAHVMFEAVCHMAWSSTFAATDLAACEIRHNAGVVGSDCFQIPYGAGTASRHCRLAWFGANIAAGTYPADLRVFRVTGSSPLTLTAAGFIAVFLYPNTVAGS